MDGSKVSHSGVLATVTGFPGTPSPPQIHPLIGINGQPLRKDPWPWWSGAGVLETRPAPQHPGAQLGQGWTLAPPLLQVQSQLSTHTEARTRAGLQVQIPPRVRKPCSLNKSPTLPVSPSPACNRPTSLGR